jgi:hypothetical protein
MYDSILSLSTVPLLLLGDSPCSLPGEASNTALPVFSPTGLSLDHCNVFLCSISIFGKLDFMSRFLKVSLVGMFRVMCILEVSFCQALHTLNCNCDLNVCL